MTATRRCSRCNEAKPVEDFAINHDEPRTWCKGCESTRVRGYLARQRAELGDKEFRRRKAQAQQERRQRSRRAS